MYEIGYELKEKGITIKKENTYEIVSKVAYLIGIPKRIFNNENEPPQIEVFNQLEKNKSARIIRHLCIVRTAIERNFKNIRGKMNTEFCSVLSLPEYVPSESIHQLNADGINFIKNTSTKLNHHIIEINRIISDRINNCKDLFPLWLKWQYVRNLFIMPNGLKVEGTKVASDLYYSNLAYYPYQMYINWIPRDEGNILYNDQKFVSLLYKQNEDCFSEYSKVSDVGNCIKGTIYDFIENGEKIIVAVDCENSDPYKLYAVFKNLDSQYIEKVDSIILFNDANTSTAWRVWKEFVDISVEHIMIERIMQKKSLVDITLTARACEEYYKNHVDSFIIAASDSDYWGLISALPDARFMVMAEHENLGYNLKEALSNTGIFYCYIDDFYSGNIDDFKQSVLLREMSDYISSKVRLNVKDMFEEALRTSRIDMDDVEKKRFFDQYIKTMKMTIEDSGNVVLSLKNRLY